MESYVERWKREKEQKKAAAEKKERRKAQKAQKGQEVPKIQKNSLYGEMQKKEVNEDGENRRGEGQAAQEAEGGRE